MNALATARWEAVIGLEVHAQLSTRSKLFCGCANDSHAPPNSLVCPVCLGLPGTLPVLNRQAVELAIRLGLACGCEFVSPSSFARKNYFYPDLPKGYQITQLEAPLCRGGSVPVDLESGTQRFDLIRIHIEEDAGKLLYASDGPTRADFNRCGTPLVEIVGEPVLREPEEAAAYLHALRRMLRWIGVSDGNMEEGSLRCDANISLRKVGNPVLGTRVELKNLNSISGVKAALEVEIERQMALLLRGEPVQQETRSWDAQARVTRRLRSKEEASDYRYFPEPDLPALRLQENDLQRIAASLPELPLARLDRWMEQWDLSPQDVRVLCEEKALADYFEDLVEESVPVTVAAAWVLGEVLRERNERSLSMEDFPVPAHATAELLQMVARRELSHGAAKSVFAEMVQKGQGASSLAKEMDLGLLDDPEELEELMQTVLEAHQDLVVKYREGKWGLLGYFVGQVMGASRGRADPVRVKALLRQALDAPGEKE